MHLGHRGPGPTPVRVGWSALLFLSLLTSCASPESRPQSAVPDDAGSARDWPSASTPPPVPPVVIEDGVTFDEALTLTRRQNPRLAAVRRTLGVSEAQQLTASQWSYNPVLSGGIEGATPFEQGQGAVAVGLSQQFEIAGQRGWRQAVAVSNVERTRAEIADAERVVTVEAASAFFEALSLGERVTLVERNLEVAQKLLDAAEARFAAKQVPELDVNLVRLEFRRVQNDLALANASRRGALMRLGTLLGLSAPPPRVVGTLGLSTQPQVARGDHDAQEGGRGSPTRWLPPALIRRTSGASEVLPAGRWGTWRFSSPAVGPLPSRRGAARAERGGSRDDRRPPAARAHGCSRSIECAQAEDTTCPGCC